MGFGVTELLIILAIVLVLFGAKKLKNVGGDLGGAIKNFKTAMADEDKKESTDTADAAATINKVESDTATIEGKVESSETNKTV